MLLAIADFGLLISFFAGILADIAVFGRLGFSWLPFFIMQLAKGQKHPTWLQAGALIGSRSSLSQSSLKRFLK